MKKVLKWTLYALNFLVIAFLIFSSVIMLLGANSDMSIFGKKALIITSADYSKKEFILYKKTDNPAVENELIIKSNNSYIKVKVSRIDNDKYVCIDENNTEYSVYTDKDNYLGKAVYSNAALGRFISYISMPENRTVMYFYIIGYVVFAALIICLIMVLYKKNEFIKKRGSKVHAEVFRDEDNVVEEVNVELESVMEGDTPPDTNTSDTVQDISLEFLKENTDENPENLENTDESITADEVERPVEAPQTEEKETTISVEMQEEKTEPDSSSNTASKESAENKTDNTDKAELTIDDILKQLESL